MKNLLGMIFILGCAVLLGSWSTEADAGVFRYRSTGSYGSTGSYASGYGSTGVGRRAWFPRQKVYRVYQAYGSTGSYSTSYGSTGSYSGVSYGSTGSYSVAPVMYGSAGK